MVIHTRYRDVPWEELPVWLLRAGLSRSAWEGDYRGKPISLRTPPFPAGRVGPREMGHEDCQGPFLPFAPPRMVHGWLGETCACPCVAEIGD